MDCIFLTEISSPYPVLDVSHATQLLRDGDTAVETDLQFLMPVKYCPFEGDLEN